MWRQLLLRSALCLACLRPQLAQADQIRLDSGVTLNLLSGEHATQTNVEHLNFVPLPLGVIDARYKRTTVHLEGLPGLTFGYGDGRGGTQYTRLSILNLVVRQSLGGGVFAGIGQTTYNQRTDYGVSESFIVARQSSRVTGARFEAGYQERILGANRLELTFAINPAMRGVERSTLRPLFRFSHDLFNSERALQIDTALQIATPLGSGEFLYGIRYLNYTSRYQARARFLDGALADRNVGLLPLIGYRQRF